MATSAEDLAPIELHGRTYQLPRRPTVVVCVDGFDPEYLQIGCVPTSIHGIAGNFYLDKKTGKEHMILDDTLLRGSTILEQMQIRGVRVAAITAKDKLRKILNHGLSPSKGAICFSAQDAKNSTVAENGISDVERWLNRPAPDQYSGDLSIFVLDAGLKLLEENRADLFYLTLSDFIQHKYAPGSPESNDFLQQLDTRLGEFVERGAVVAVTGDHGMSDKSNADGSPNILFLEDELHAKWPRSGARVICPISDPFVKHHGALGGFVRVHLIGSYVAEELAEMVRFCQSLPQVEVAYTGEHAAAVMDMPFDREGDIVVISKENAVVGSRKDEHDLSQVQGHRLRSHGGLSEQNIPLIRSTPLHDGNRMRPQNWRNFDIFDVALNWQ